MAKVQWSHLPAATPGGDLLPHMSANLRRSIVDAVFTGAGGPERMLAWVEKSDDNYEVFLKQIWAPGQAKAVSAELGVSEGVEALLEKLDRAEAAQTIDGEYTESEAA